MNEGERSNERRIEAIKKRVRNTNDTLVGDAIRGGGPISAVSRKLMVTDPGVLDPSKVKHPGLSADIRAIRTLNLKNKMRERAIAQKEKDADLAEAIAMFREVEAIVESIGSARTKT
jgi:hypothetical protein